MNNQLEVARKECDGLKGQLRDMTEKKETLDRGFRERGRLITSLKAELEQLQTTDPYEEMETMRSELKVTKSIVAVLLPMAKRQIKERFMLEVGGAELEREKKEGGHQSTRLAFLATPQPLLKAVEVLREQGLDVGGQKLQEVEEEKIERYDNNAER